jgi:uncharacterized protein YuzE
MKNSKQLFSYDPDADAVMLSVAEEVNIDYATEFGNVLVNFSKEGKPVLIEILQASKFFKKYKDSFNQLGVALA